MAPGKGEAKAGEGKGSPTKKRKMKSPSKAAPVEFDWSAELIEECMLRGDSGAHLAKYCGSNEQIRAARARRPRGACTTRGSGRSSRRTKSL